MTSVNEVSKSQVIHVDFKAEKRRKTPASPQQISHEPAYMPAQVRPIRAWDNFSLRNKMLDISGWWIRLSVFLGLVALGYSIWG